jgi:hypothetical protein
MRKFSALVLLPWAIFLSVGVFAADTYQPPSLVRKGIIPQGAAAAGGVAGSDTQVQFNDASAMAGDAGLTFNKTTNVLTATGGFYVPPAGAAQYDELYDTAGTYRQVIESAGTPAGNGCIAIDLNGAGVNKALMGGATAVGASGLTCASATFVEAPVIVKAGVGSTTQGAVVDTTLATATLSNMAVGGRILIKAMYTQTGGTTITPRWSIKFGGTDVISNSTWGDAYRMLEVELLLTATATEYITAKAYRFGTTDTNGTSPGTVAASPLSVSFATTAVVNINGWLSSDGVAAGETVKVAYYEITYFPPKA